MQATRNNVMSSTGPGSKRLESMIGFPGTVKFRNREWLRLGLSIALAAARLKNRLFSVVVLIIT